MFPDIASCFREGKISLVEKNGVKKLCGYQNWWFTLSRRWDHRKSNIWGRINHQVILERLSWWPSEHPAIIWEVSGIGLAIINLHKWQYKLINHSDRRSSCWEIQELLIEIEAYAWMNPTHDASVVTYRASSGYMISYDLL